ncbi:hypothetical protein HGA91_03225 [candidate division WWE3 bacterium]|nr:hypothetical protein [candidate division WWE3 bacterium]
MFHIEDEKYLRYMGFTITRTQCVRCGTIGCQVTGIINAGETGPGDAETLMSTSGWRISISRAPRQIHPHECREHQYDTYRPAGRIVDQRLQHGTPNRLKWMRRFGIGDNTIATICRIIIRQ